MYTIYKMHCKSNNKDYIGITDNFERRFAVHWNDAKKKNTVLARTIRKYGKKNFIIEKIDYAKTSDDACLKEQMYITLLNTKVPNGMNMTDGGEGVFGFNHSDETKKKMSESHKGMATGSDNPMYGKPGSMLGKEFSEEHKRNLSNAMKGRTPWNKGKKGLQVAWNKDKTGIYSDEVKKKMIESRRCYRCSEETKEKIRISNKDKQLGSRHSQTNFIDDDIIEIRRLYSNKIMNQKQLADKYNVTQSNISCIVRNKSWKHIDNKGEK